jgi:glycosyltransferase involved in cell wall biosynthesis
MSEPKVSIIIPVYNTAEYVRQAVESITEQTLREIEIIVVNDGSTDGSLQILEELAAQDTRIQVYSQENKGQSVARNNGVQHATGQYLYFMDSDDLLDADALELCYKKCEELKLDFVFFDAEILNKDSALAMELNYKRYDQTDDKQVYDGQELLRLLVMKHAFSPSPCLSFIRTSYFKNARLSFYPNIIHEDQLFTCLLYLKAKRVMSIHQSFFKRRFRAGSTMTRKFAWKNMQGYLTVSDELLNYAKANQEVRPVIDLFLKQMLDAAVWQAHVLPFRQRIRLFRKSASKYKQYVSKRTLALLLFKSFAPK